MITVESLTRRYAGFTAVDNVSFTALPGRVTGFLGPNSTDTVQVSSGPRLVALQRSEVPSNAVEPAARPSAQRWRLRRRWPR